MKKAIPTFKTDKEAEDFVATADLTEYDLSGGQVMRFEMKRKDKSVKSSPASAALGSCAPSGAKSGYPLSAVYPHGA